MSPKATKSGGERRADGLADIPAVAVVIGDRTRAAMLDALVDERDLPAIELARRVGVSPSTASAHLALLVEARLVAVERHGRQRRYRLAGPPVAAALEALAAIAPLRPVQSLGEATRDELLRDGRTCYDHLAGRLGVELTGALSAQGLLRRRDGAYLLTRRGEQVLGDLGVDVVRVRAQRRPFAFPCLDWSERREHLAGALGAALADRLFALGWVTRVGPGRAATLTESGRKELGARFGLELPAAAIRAR
jgi:DNA-binding transcriptional ArsR family regulator